MPGTQVGHAPLISVVIPVHGVRRYLAGCLDSVLGQDAEVPVEVIAVDDASPDGCGALLDERSESDSRLTAVHLERSGGPGNARNVGLGRASGSYVWFVDGDDLIAPGALAAIAARLRSDRPDVLLVGYSEFSSRKKPRPGPGGQVLRSAPPGVFTLAQAPQVINLSMTAWSKLFGRSFLAGLREPFRAGIHEDIPVTCAALLTGRLSALAEPCYCYRRSRPGSFMATTTAGHFAVFSAYEEVLGMLGKLAAAGDPVATEAVRSAVFERAISHYMAVLQTTGPGIGAFGRPGLVPRGERRRFFERAHADFARYAPPGYQLPAGARGMKLALLRSGSYLGYEFLEPLNRLRVSLRRSRRGRSAAGG